MATNLTPHAPGGLICPLMREDQSKVCHTCPFWTQFSVNQGVGQPPLSDWACAISWLPKLLVENAQQTRQAGGSVDKLREEVSSVGSALTQITQSAQQRLRQP